jgi:hypothetical protein
MGLTNCRECDGTVSTEAKACPNCGVKDPAPSAFWGKAIWGWVIVFGVVWLFWSGTAQKFFVEVAKSTSKACTVRELDLKTDVFAINGEPDFGVRATVTIEKLERAGDVSVTVRISSTEGDLEKTRTVRFNEGQRRNVDLTFPELTINASDINGVASCST